MANAEDRLNAAVRATSADITKKGLSAPRVNFSLNHDDEIGVDREGAGQIAVTQKLVEGLSDAQLKALVAVEMFKEQAIAQNPNGDERTLTTQAAGMAARVYDAGTVRQAMAIAGRDGEDGTKMAAAMGNMPGVAKAMAAAQAAMGVGDGAPSPRAMGEMAKRLKEGSEGLPGKLGASTPPDGQVDEVLGDAAKRLGVKNPGAAAPVPEPAAEPPAPAPQGGGYYNVNSNPKLTAIRKMVLPGLNALIRQMDGATFRQVDIVYAGNDGGINVGVSGNNDRTPNADSNPVHNKDILTVSEGAYKQLKPEHIRALAEFVVAENLIHTNHENNVRGVPHVNVNDGNHQAAQGDLKTKTLTAAQNDEYQDYLDAAALVKKMGDGAALAEALKRQNAEKGPFNAVVRSGEGVEVPSLSVLLDELGKPSTPAVPASSSAGVRKER